MEQLTDGEGRVYEDELDPDDALIYDACEDAAECVVPAPPLAPSPQSQSTTAAGSSSIGPTDHAGRWINELPGADQNPSCERSVAPGRGSSRAGPDLKACRAGPQGVPATRFMPVPRSEN